MKNTIKYIREERGITQEELAKKVKTTRQTINSIEAGRNYPSVMLSIKIARFLNKPIEELFFLEEFD